MPYDDRLGAPFARWLATASLIRAPVLMASVASTTLTALLLGDADRGGVLAAASVAGMLAGTPLGIALQRRVSARPLLIVQLLACSAAWCTMAVLAHAGIVVLVVVAGFAGVTMAGSAGLVRSTMSDAVPRSRLASASTIDALAQDAVIVAAPLAVALGATFGPRGAPASVAVLALLAAVAIGLGPRHARAAPSDAWGPQGGRLPAPPVARWITWSLLSAGVGTVLGAIEAGAVGLSARLGLGVERAWALFAILAAASALGAAIDVSVLQRRLPRLRPPLVVGVLVVGSVLVAVGGATPLAILGVGIAGLPTAAVLGLRSHVFDLDAPSHRRTALTVAFAAQSIGFAAGTASLASIGQAGALAVGTVVVLVSAVPALVQLDRMRPR